MPFVALSPYMSTPKWMNDFLPPKRHRVINPSWLVQFLAGRSKPGAFPDCLSVAHIQQSPPFARSLSPTTSCGTCGSAHARQNPPLLEKVISNCDAIDALNLSLIIAHCQYHDAIEALSRSYLSVHANESD